MGVFALNTRPGVQDSILHAICPTTVKSACGSPATASVKNDACTADPACCLHTRSARAVAGVAPSEPTPLRQTHQCLDPQVGRRGGVRHLTDAAARQRRNDAPGLGHAPDAVEGGQTMDHLTPRQDRQTRLSPGAQDGCDGRATPTHPRSPGGRDPPSQ